MKNDNLPLPDEQLATLVQQGDKEKFGLLVDRYQQKLIRYGSKFLYDHNNVEDIVQDIFIRAYQNIQSFDTKQKFSPWIYRIAHNMFINAIKKYSRNPLYFFDLDTIMPHLVYEDSSRNEREQAETKKMVDKGLNLLDPKYREIIVLYYYEELGYKEIADILQIPVGTVGIRLQRAKERLKKLLPRDI